MKTKSVQSPKSKVQGQGIAFDLGLWALGFGLLLFLCLMPAVAGFAADDGVHVELPAGGALRVENWRGNVQVEVWSGANVSVTALIDGATAKSSLVVVERTPKLLKISVARQRPGSLPQRVDLVVRVPQRSRAEIVTSSGEIVLRGTPAELKARTIKGDIRAEVNDGSNADVTAESLSGKVDSTLTVTTVAASERLFRATFGTGRNLLQLRSARGRITLVPAELPVETVNTSPTPENVSQPAQTEIQPTARDSGRPPTLVGVDRSGTGAGTPATPLATPEEIDDEDIIRVDTELVTVNMSVIDRGTNRGLTGLTQNDFRVYEDGVPQQIAHFEAASAPFNLFLLIDLSSSTQDVLKLIREAALQFVNAARPNDRISIITFGMVNVVVSPLTNDREALRRSIQGIDKHLGSTNLYDAVGFTMDEVQKNAKDSRRNAIVLMSDGLDSTLPNVTGDGSKIEYQELLRRVRELDGVLYTLWVNTETEYSSLSVLDVQPETYDLAHDRMSEMADAGGGIFYEVEGLEDLAEAYTHVVADLGTVYSIGYNPTNKQRDGKWRAIRVQVSRPQAVARGKRGYYAN